MMYTRLSIAAGLLCALVAADAVMAQGRGGRGGQQIRDAMRQVPAGTAVVAGRVVAADTGRPLKRARVMLTGGGRPFSATTDDEGRYRVERLPAASYTVVASKTGYVDGTFGQRRPGAPGVPVELADGQQVGNVDLRLIRGGVITGHVADEDGQPLANAVVTVQRQQYVQGERQLVPAGRDQSDDRGQFRIFGLPPGDYFVSASSGGTERLAMQVLPLLTGDAATPETTGYADTYYPGVIAPGQAAPVRLGPGQEVSGVDFPLQLVALATVRGVVAGGPAVVMLLPEGGGAAVGGRGGRGGGRGGLAPLLGALAGGRGGALRAAASADGTFVIPNVTPGNYTIVARIGDGGGGAQATAVQPITVSGSEVSVALSPAPPVSATGTVTLEATGGSMPGTLTGFRVTLTPLGAAAAVPRPNRPAAASDRGEFTVDDLIPGQYIVSAAAPQGWAMKAVYLNGADATDRAIEIRSTGLSGLNLIFTDRVAALSGTVTDGSGAPAAAITVIAFPADQTHWHPHSRYIRTARSDQAGAYHLNALPPADYLVVAVDDVDQGEWFDPAFLEQMRRHAEKVRVGEGEQVVRNLTPAAGS